MSALELYIKGALQTKGTSHLWAIQSLRRYINLTPEADLIAYINMIIDKDHLRILIEAGLRGAVHRAAVSRTQQLIEQQK